MATRHHSTSMASMKIAPDSPIVGIIVEEDGQQVAHYFSDVQTAREAFQGSVPDVLSLAGAWADLDWEEILDTLDRMRRESVPTPPIEEL